MGSSPGTPSLESDQFYSNLPSEYTNRDRYNGFFKDVDTNYGEDWRQLSVINSRKLMQSSEITNYWLASRFVDVSTSTWRFWCLCVSNVNGELEIKHWNILYRSSSLTCNSVSCGFRPVFTLKSTVKIKEGIGDGTTAYELE